MAAQQPIPQDPEEKQTDLLATLAAARELGPDMDKALAESYLQRQRAEAAPKQPVVAQPPQAPQQAGAAFRPIFFTMPAGLILFIVLLVVSHGALWWLFFPIMGCTGWWWRGGSRAEWHDQRRAQREQWRQARRGPGYGYRYGYRYDYRYGDDHTNPRDEQAQLDTPAAPAAPSAPPLPPVAPAPPASSPSASPSPAGQQPPVNPAG